jgi:hypothetical protein
MSRVNVHVRSTKVEFSCILRTVFMIQMRKRPSRRLLDVCIIMQSVVGSDLPTSADTGL